MPTPVSTARQCLTGDAARALDEAVSVAKRRCHAQTTSLHAISALLALPSSALRDACARARSSAYSPRLQFRALDLSFSVALDRLPSSSTNTSSSDGSADPPISNSLMAAIKRSQANQRRNPESFFLQQQQNQTLASPSSSSSSPPSNSSSSILCVKVDLQPLILSILDDPIVSRVFADAGFRSCDIKLALLRPLPSLRSPRSRCPPLFLCNFEGDVGIPRRSTFNFPFSGVTFNTNFSDSDENCRRVGEVLVRKKGRNPLLVGVYALDAARSFEDCLERGGGEVVPKELSGLKFVCIEKEVTCEQGLPSSRLEELGRLAERCVGPGIVIGVGDLNGLLRDSASHVIAGLTRLLEFHPGRIWLMGAAANYETYMKFLNRYPSVEKDWDLQLLPITSLRPVVGGLYPRPHSLMESFVPFGGSFPTASDFKRPLSSTYPSVFCCHLCNQQYEQQVAALLKECTVSVADQNQVTLPLLLRSSDLSSIDSGLEVTKAKDDGTALNDKVINLQKKWSDICQRIHRGSQLLEGDNCRVGHQLGPGIVNLPYITDMREKADNFNVKSTCTSANPSAGGYLCPRSADPKKTCPPDLNKPIPVVCESKNENLLPELPVKASKSGYLHAQGLQSHSCSPANDAIPDCCAPYSLVTSVTTDLSLGPPLNDPKKSMIQIHKNRLQEFSGCSPTKVDLVNRSIMMEPVQAPSAHSGFVGHNAHLGMRTTSNSETAGMAASKAQGLGSPAMAEQFDSRDFKTLWRGLAEKVSWQEEAICAISQTIARCKAGNERRRGASLKGDIWLSLLGPDRVGKRRVALALAEMVLGGEQKLIHVDLNAQDGIAHNNAIFDIGQALNGYVRSRGNLMVDHIAAEVRKKPLSVVFLENVDKADLVLQNSLSQAIRTGKFPDSHGKEISINNAIFITTLRAFKGETVLASKECFDYSEDKILAARPWQMCISVSSIPHTVSNKKSNLLVTPQSVSRNEKPNFGQEFINKRKLESMDDDRTQCDSLETAKRLHRTSSTCLDLNLSIEEMEANDMDSGDDDNDRISEHPEAWLEDLHELMDETVIFKPYNFDALADNISKRIGEAFQRKIGPGCLLEIDCKVMELMVAVAWVSDGSQAIDGWIQRVLGESFTEARERYGRNLSAGCVLKLATCEDRLIEEQAPGVCLPARIVFN